MNSRKRWQTIYSQENPLALPQAIIREINQCYKNHAPAVAGKLKYLWIHMPANDADTTPSLDSKPLGEDEWLSVIDEAASVGVLSVIISVGGPLQFAPLLAPVAMWAQEAYGMTVGIHPNAALERVDADVLLQLDLSKTRVFANSEHLESARFVEELGIPLYNADGLQSHSSTHACDLPESMTCIGPEGQMYTCGLVMGEERYSLGHVLERKLASVMTDKTLPHTVPAAVGVGTQRCNGCPPLMAQKLQDGL